MLRGAWCEASALRFAKSWLSTTPTPAANDARPPYVTQAAHYYGARRQAPSGSLGQEARTMTFWLDAAAGAVAIAATVETLLLL